MVCVGMVSGVRDIDAIDTFDATTNAMNRVIDKEEDLPYVVQEITTAKHSIEGGERDVLFNITSAPLGSFFDTGVFQGNWAVEFAAHSEGTVLLQYDGKDGTSYLNRTGLGGVDLARKGADCLHLEVVAGGELSYRIVVYDMGGRSAERTFQAGRENLDDVLLFYTDFALHQQVQLNWQLVGALEVFAIAPQDADEPVRSTLFKLATADSTIGPSPASPVSSEGLSPVGRSPEHEHKEGDSLPVSVLLTAFAVLMGVMGLLAILGIIAAALLVIYGRISRKR